MLQHLDSGLRFPHRHRYVGIGVSALRVPLSMNARHLLMPDVFPDRIRSGLDIGGEMMPGKFETPPAQHRGDGGRGVVRGRIGFQPISPPPSPRPSPPPPHPRHVDFADLEDRWRSLGAARRRTIGAGIHAARRSRNRSRIRDLIGLAAMIMLLSATPALQALELVLAGVLVCQRTATSCCGNTHDVFRGDGVPRSVWAGNPWSRELLGIAELVAPPKRQRAAALSWRQ